MNEHVQAKEAGAGEWQLLTDAEVQATPQGHQVSIPATSEFASRLTGAGLRKYHVIFTDPTNPTTVPNLWRGVLRTWKPSGDRMLLDVRPAATIEDLLDDLPR